MKTAHAAAVEVQALSDGLANTAGRWAGHYFSHNTASTLTALFPFDLNNWYGLPAQGIAVDNWADDNFDHSGLDFIGGGNLWYIRRRPIGREHEHVRQSAGLGLAWKSFVKQNADRWNIAYLQNDAAVRGHILDLDPTARMRSDPGVPDHGRVQGKRQEDRRFHTGEDGAVVHGGGAWRSNEGRSARWAVHARVRRTRMGNNRETNVVDSWASRTKYEPRRAGCLRDGHQWRSQPTLTAQPWLGARRST